MDNNIFEHIARQLRKPEGDLGKVVAEKMSTGNQLINEWTIDALHLKPHDNVLEIGMGNGAFVKRITEGDVSIRYTGIDYSPLMIEEATKRNTKLIRANQAHFLLGTAEELPFLNHIFNKVFTVNTIYFWDNPVKIFNEIKRVLKPEGMLVISIRPKEIMKDFPFVPYGFRLFSRNEVTALLQENGFEVEEVIERNEPDQELNGKMVPTASLIVVSTFPAL
jgi:ubiquinone/menaquinone biosynthesis C-methylase UbiE